MIEATTTEIGEPKTKIQKKDFFNRVPKSRKIKDINIGKELKKGKLLYLIQFITKSI